MKKKPKLLFKNFLSSFFSKELWDGAAALSFYYILSIFPALLILLKLSSFVYYNLENIEISNWLQSSVPSDMRDIFSTLAEETKKTTGSNLWTLTYLASIWAMLNGISATFRQLNIIHETENERTIIKDRLVSLLVSAMLFLVIFLSPLLSIIGNLAIKYFEVLFGMNILSSILVIFVKYSLLLIISIGFFMNLYFWGPVRKMKIREIMPGSAVAAFIFIMGTEAFSRYLKSVTDYSAIYGSASVVVCIILWLYLVGLSVLFGAQLNKILIDLRLKKN